MPSFLPPRLPVITPENAGRLAPLAELPHQWGANTVAFSPDRTLIASGAGDDVMLWGVRG
jgi:hypothetical protein